LDRRRGKKWKKEKEEAEKKEGEDTGFFRVLQILLLFPLDLSLSLP
jgi:hypothetical protein